MRPLHRATPGALLLLLAASLSAQCPDDLAPLDDQTGISTALVMAEVAPGTHIVLFNTTDSDIALSGSLYQFCSPFNYMQLSALAPGVTVPSRGYATVPWPGNFNDTDAGGEVQLYSDGNFGNSTHIMDFVCWGSNPHGSRKFQAESVGKWSGDCAPALSNGAIRRRVASQGKSAASYDTGATPTVANCTPDCAPELVPTDDGTGIAADLILSELRPGSYIELYNTTAAPIDLGSVSHQLCSPFTYVTLASLAPDTIVPGEGFAVIPWPSSFADSAAGGEVQLYSDGNFGNSTHILDFACWGSNPHGSRKGQAESVGKWLGPCSGVLVDGSLHRLGSTDGTDIGSYDEGAGASPNACPGGGATTTPRHEPRIPLFAQLSCAPNPFNPRTLIQFTLRDDARVRIDIYRADGARIDRIEAGLLRAGERNVAWDALDAEGRRLPSGVYYYQLEGGDEHAAGKMLLVE